jgi:rhamnosyltransferase
MTEPAVTILLATCNGERWLSEQIRSIVGQSYSHWRLFVSDDNSSDNTVDLLSAFVGRDERISLLPAREGPPGHVANFEYLLETVESLDPGRGIVFLADQDDIWCPDKLQTLVDVLDNSPIDAAAVFSDLELMDADGVLSGSYLGSLGLLPPENMAALIARNSVTGCSMAFRTGLLDVALPFPPRLENHDWWLGMCAMSTSGLAYSHRKLVSYRQHGANAIGANNLPGQLLRIGHLVRRQNRVIESKLIAMSSLEDRLSSRGLPVPGSLTRYRLAFSGKNRFATCWQLLTGEFKPGSTRLLLTQLISVLLR